MIEVSQILMAYLCGLLIGLERQYHGASVGIRTYSLVCLGACLYALVSTHAQGAAYYHSVVDPTRIAAQIVTGVGFIGGGIIFKDKDRVRGITTAATLWVVSAIGVGIAFEMYLLALITTIIVLFTLFLNQLSINKKIHDHGQKTTNHD